MFTEPVVVGCRRIAERCGLHPQTVRNRIITGTFPGEMVGDRWFARVADIDAWVAAQTAPPRRHKPRQARATA